MAGRQQTAPPQPRRSKSAKTHRTSTPARGHRPPKPGQVPIKKKSPLRNRILFLKRYYLPPGRRESDHNCERVEQGCLSTYVS
jgi:hypothetical protein